MARTLQPREVVLSYLQSFVGSLKEDTIQDMAKAMSEMVTPPIVNPKIIPGPRPPLSDGDIAKIGDAAKKLLYEIVDEILPFTTVKVGEARILLVKSGVYSHAGKLVNVNYVIDETQPNRHPAVACFYGDKQIRVSDSDEAGNAYFVSAFYMWDGMKIRAWVHDSYANRDIDGLRARFSVIDGVVMIIDRGVAFKPDNPVDRSDLERIANLRDKAVTALKNDPKEKFEEVDGELFSTRLTEDELAPLSKMAQEIMAMEVDDFNPLVAIPTTVRDKKVVALRVGKRRIGRLTSTVSVEIAGEYPPGKVSEHSVFWRTNFNDGMSVIFLEIKSITSCINAKVFVNKKLLYTYGYTFHPDGTFQVAAGEHTANFSV